MGKCILHLPVLLNLSTVANVKSSHLLVTAMMIVYKMTSVTCL